MNSTSNPDTALFIPTLCIAVVSLVIGLWLLFQKTHAGKQVSLLLIALVPPLVLFSVFPQSKASGTVLGISVTGAVALFLAVWQVGEKSVLKAISVDDLNDKIRGLEEDLKKSAIQATPSIIRQTKAFIFPLNKNKDKKIVLITGNIQNVKSVDIWVNSENTNMQMSRYYESTVSGIIRYLGAKKGPTGEVEANGDVIAAELKTLMGSSTFVQPMTVFATSPGELSQSNNVKRILHVAAVHGQPASGYKAVQNIEVCVTRVLDRANQQDIADLGCKSILFPLLGAGTAKGNLPDLAQRLLLAAIQHLETANSNVIESVYFLVWTDLELETCKKVLTDTGSVVVSRQ